jgi:hypothetical protein
VVRAKLNATIKFRTFQELLLARNVVLLTKAHQVSWLVVGQAIRRGPGISLKSQQSGPEEMTQLARVVQTR